MPLSPTPAERRARARADLRMGLPVCLTQGGAAALVAAVETLGPVRFEQLTAGGAAVMVVTARRAETLKARAYDGDLARIELPPGASLGWAQAVADPVDDLSEPMKGPFRTARGGDVALHRAGIALAKEARLLPAVLFHPWESAQAARAEGLTVLDLATDLPREEGARYSHVVSARLPMALAEAGRLHIFRPDDGAEEHYAVEIGQPDRAAPVLARLHSACFTGDLLGSLKCDCGPQLRGALKEMGEAGAGVLLYLNQEGRGIGLANKMRAYALQDQGFDTVEANHRLGFEDDERDFRIGAALLREMGFGAVRLMTNNPAKIEMMRAQGIEVTERVPLKVGHNEINAGYLATKAAKSGHLL
ncbi:GTP cyclohydrolase II [Tropicimonas sp. IMCC6043]|uniref:GTP cyclohydrolase II n=1 Tax=Tropicimonas sp. IMCC6043 TaxID=2510645 RepID=UPI00101B85FF|nr:GTP cyclohydrolase II [Tropicimonas sp. IMCC6043]RYH09084.1 GTP cyclohydrolase II [Tropicimonas sp. IMCC6043]